MSMHFFRSRVFLWLILTAPVLLVGCSQQPNYAPVTGSDQIPKDSGNPVRENNPMVSDKKEAIKENPVGIQVKKVETETLGKIYVVKNGDTLYSIGIKSGFGYERLAQWNQLSKPYQVFRGQQLKLFKPVAEDNTTNKTYSSSVGRGELKPPKNSVIPSNNKKKPVEMPVFSNQKPEISVAKIAIKQEKKSIISTDNKKMLKLNFAWPIKGKISKNFYQSNNKGIDIAGKIGQKVLAAESGKIAYSGQGLIGFGNLIIIQHNNLYLSAYGNNSSLMVKEGEQVEKGQAIAEVGKALSKKAALHFEIRKNGKPVNPLEFLPKSEKAH